MFRRFSEWDIKDILLRRPEKGAVWGLGGKLIKLKQVQFKKFQTPTHRRIMKFLTSQDIKDIEVHDLRKINIPVQYLMVGTGNTPRHVWKAANSLEHALKQAEIPKYQYLKTEGSRDLGSALTTIGTLYVNLLSEQFRSQLNFEEILAETTPEEREEFILDCFRDKVKIK